MHRRTVLQSMAALVAAPAVPAIDLLAQTGDLTPANIAALRALGDTVLPASIGADGRDEAVRRFVGWVRGYREGADRGHGYGNSQLSPRTGPSPAGRYPAQFAALDDAAKAMGAASFAALDPARRRTVVEKMLNEPQRAANLPQRPNGANLVADFMGLYFNGPAARDVCYNARIARDDCRGLDGSDQPPPPIKASSEQPVVGPAKHAAGLKAGGSI